MKTRKLIQYRITVKKFNWDNIYNDKTQNFLFLTQEFYSPTRLTLNEIIDNTKLNVTDKNINSLNIDFNEIELNEVEINKIKIKDEIKEVVKEKCQQQI